MITHSGSRNFHFKMQKTTSSNTHANTPPPDHSAKRVGGFEFDFESMLIVYQQRMSDKRPHDERWRDSVVFLEEMIFEQIQGGKPFS